MTNTRSTRTDVLYYATRTDDQITVTRRTTILPINGRGASYKDMTVTVEDILSVPAGETPELIKALALGLIEN